MSAAHEVLNDFGIAHEVRVVSAHRTPEAMLEYAHQAAGRGLRLIIAGAGGAAHLPGMIASATPLPVIGVPVNITALDGLDALLSIAQMPRGVPVACVGVDQAANAALLAARLLAAGDLKFSDRLMAKLLEYREQSQRKVELSQRRLRTRLKT
jgi:5-(carboxyamino)imidazole ribonucleotide mutase